MLDFDEHGSLIWISSNFDENFKHLEKPNAKIVDWHIMNTLE